MYKLGGKKDELDVGFELTRRPIGTSSFNKNEEY
jgi:hypothetical protein